MKLRLQKLFWKFVFCLPPFFDSIPKIAKLIFSRIQSATKDGKARRQAAQQRWSVIRLVKSCDTEAEEVARKEKLQVNVSGLGNTRRFYCNSNSWGSELQGIGQILSPLEFYCKELIKHSEVQKRIGKSGKNYNSNKRAILSSKQLSLCLVDRYYQKI